MSYTSRAITPSQHPAGIDLVDRCAFTYDPPLHVRIGQAIEPNRDYTKRPMRVPPGFKRFTLRTLKRPRMWERWAPYSTQRRTSATVTEHEGRRLNVRLYPVDRLAGHVCAASSVRPPHDLRVVYLKIDHVRVNALPTASVVLCSPDRFDAMRWLTTPCLPDDGDHLGRLRALLHEPAVGPRDAAITDALLALRYHAPEPWKIASDYIVAHLGPIVTARWLLHLHPSVASDLTPAGLSPQAQHLRAEVLAMWAIVEAHAHQLAYPQAQPSTPQPPKPQLELFSAPSRAPSTPNGTDADDADEDDAETAKRAQRLERITGAAVELFVLNTPEDWQLGRIPRAPLDGHKDDDALLAWEHEVLRWLSDPTYDPNTPNAPEPALP